MDNNLNENNADPLALETETENSIEYDFTSFIEPEIIIEDSAELRRIKQSTLPAENGQLTLSRVQAEADVEPLFRITPKMQQRIKRMKQRMLATLKLSDQQLTQRCAKRTTQTRQSRRKSADSDAEYPLKETDKKLARTQIQRAMETPKQLAERKAKKREEDRRYQTKRRSNDTTEQKSNRREYQRIYGKNRKPISFT